MGDDDDGTRHFAQAGGDGGDAGEQGRAGFAAGRGEIERVGGPAVERGAGDVVPRHAFPRAEIDLVQSRVDGRREVVGGADGIGEEAAAQGGAGQDGGGGEMSEARGDGGDGGVAFGGEAEIAAPIADAGRDVGFRVAQQGEARGWER